MTNVSVKNLCFYRARFSIQSLFKTTPCPLKRQPENHTGVLASDCSHEYTVDRRSMSLTEWMVHLRVNEIFARVNKRRGMNEIFVSNFLYYSITCICLAFFYWKHISNREYSGEFQALWLCALAVSNLSLQKNRTGAITFFTTRYHAYSIEWWHLCCLHEPPVKKLSARIAVLLRVSDTWALRVGLSVDVQA